MQTLEEIFQHLFTCILRKYKNSRIGLSQHVKIKIYSCVKEIVQQRNGNYFSYPTVLLCLSSVSIVLNLKIVQLKMRDKKQHSDYVVTYNNRHLQRPGPCPFYVSYSRTSQSSARLGIQISHLLYDPKIHINWAINTITRCFQSNSVSNKKQFDITESNAKRSLAV